MRKITESDKLRNIEKKVNVQKSLALDKLRINKESIKKRVDEKLVFSFELLDREHEYFNLGKVCSEWYLELLDVLKHISSLTWKELSTQYGPTYQPHNYDWKKTNFKFNLDQDILDQMEPRQIRINKSKGRIHGLLIGNRFYIHWLDRYHNMTDSKGYGKAEKYPYPKTCFENQQDQIHNLNREVCYLKSEIKEYEKLLDEAAMSKDE